MSKTSYTMVTAHYEKMNEYGCVHIIEGRDVDEKQCPLRKQLMTALELGDELVIAKFSNAICDSRELAAFLDFCHVKVIHMISIHDRTDS